MMQNFWCIALLSIAIISVQVVSAAKEEKGIFGFMKNFSCDLYPVDFDQPALVRAAANLVVDFHDRGNAASLITSEVYNTSHQEHTDILNSFARRVSPVIALSVINVDYIFKQRFKNPLNIFVIDGLEAFKKIYLILSPRRFRIFAYYLVIVSHTGPKMEEEFQEILNMFYERSILNVNILTTHRIERKRSVLYSYHPYLPESCGQPKMIIHNKYMHGVFTDKNKPMFPKKLKNFHMCPLSVATFNLSKFIKIIPLDTSFNETLGGTTGYKLVGFEGKLINLLSQLLNFTIDLVIPEEKWGEIHSNGTFTGASKLLRDREVNLSIGFFVNHLNVYRTFEPSVSYFAASFAFVTAPGRPFTSLQRYVRPFQKSIWYSIIGVLVASSLFQVICNLFPGSRIVGPIRTQSFVRIYLGMDIPKYPSTAFSRILVICLVFTSLVIRFLYQCSLFYFLTGNLNYAPFERLSAMFEANLRFFIEDKMLFLFDVIPGVQYKAQIVKREEIKDLMKKAQDWRFDGVIVTARSFVPKNIHIAREKVFATNIVMVFPKYSFLAHAFDTKILRCLNNGLIEHWSRGLERYHVDTMAMEVHRVAPMILFHFRGLMFVGLFGYACAFIVLLLEIASKRFNCLRKLFVRAE